jgi:hypothetical protein
MNKFIFMIHQKRSEHTASLLVSMRAELKNMNMFYIHVIKCTNSME